MVQDFFHQTFNIGWLSTTTQSLELIENEHFPLTNYTLLKWTSMILSYIPSIRMNHWWSSRSWETIVPLEHGWSLHMLSRINRSKNPNIYGIYTPNLPMILSLCKPKIWSVEPGLSTQAFLGWWPTFFPTHSVWHATPLSAACTRLTLREESPLLEGGWLKKWKE